MKTFEFTSPIAYGDRDLTEITLRRPMSGDLRGIKLRGLHDMEVDALHQLVPRISSPAVSVAQLAAMDAHDTVRLMDSVMDFFNSPADQSPTTSTTPGE